MAPILDIKDLKVSFSTEEGELKALNGVNISIDEGTFHGLIGETGCGKSVTGRSIMKLLDNNALIKSGKILYNGENLLEKSEKEMQNDFRGNELAMIFQDPGSSLNPVFTIENQLKESVKMYRNADKSKYREIIKDELKKVKLPDVENLLEKYPYQLSGGMKQRVMIAMMLACNPNFLIADEPTTALDVSIQAQFLKVLNDLKDKLQMTVLYITHDLAVISEICDYVSVMYAGNIVEEVSVDELFKNPAHPYTDKLVHSLLGPETEIEDLVEIPGSVPRLIDPPAGCRFHPRCEEAKEICKQERPELKEVSENHSVACHRR